MGLISFTVKTGIVTSAVYWTYENKVWGTSKQTTQLYEKISAQAQPIKDTMKKQIPFEIPILPSSGETRFLVKHYYNNGVKNTIYFIHRLPCYMGQWAMKAQTGIKSLLDQQKQTQPAEKQ